ncbi:MAG: HU family DNA-binding protein [Verrucomicrobia bacterium]|nr:HU family DNA-binding protein [Verrucomicrobiota bacterium]
MNKEKLVLAVQKSLGNNTSKAQAERVVVAVLEGIKHGLKKDHAVQLVGFGSFKIVNRKARMGVNPNTLKSMKIKASKVVRFSAGKDLKGVIK